MTGPRLAAAVVVATCALVPVTASASASDDARVTWEQVRAALVAARRPPTPQPAPPATAPADPAAAGSVAATVPVTIPDLTWALDDPTASPGVRRAACHQVTGLDDETAAPLAACLAHLGTPAPGHGTTPGHTPSPGHTPAPGHGTPGHGPTSPSLASPWPSSHRPPAHWGPR